MVRLQNTERSMRQSLDWGLVAIYLALVLFGWINIYASVQAEEPSGILDMSVRSGKQFIWILTAFGLGALIVFVIPPRFWESAALPMYLGVMCLLVGVIFLGIEVKGSRSWFEFGPVRFQPAEISKITTSLLLALVMSQSSFRLRKMRDFIIAASVVGIPMLVILAESETGSALVYLGFMFMFFREGMSGWVLTLVGLAIVLFIVTMTVSSFVSVLVLAGCIAVFIGAHSGRLWSWLLPAALVIAALSFLPRLLGLFPEGSFMAGLNPAYIVAGAAILSLPSFLWKAYREKDNFLALSTLAFVAGLIMVFSTDFIFNNVLQDHQRSRIEVLLGMKEDPMGVGYNVNQSMIAIGSGGLVGKGFLHGTQTAYGFVPEQSTDFIFCTVGEEWGFLGCLLVIGLYVMMIWKIVRDAEHGRSGFTRIYGYCVAGMLFMHLIINVGMTVGLMPVIGIPLPLMSYGGSSLWAFTILIFIFIALDRDEKKYF